ncbi:MAG: tetratricopeptide repeat protein [Ginsengibacter sp.]
MIKLLATLLFIYAVQPVFGQNRAIDSLAALVKQHPQPDTLRVNLLNKLTYEYQSIGSELDLGTAEEALGLARKLEYPKGEASAQNKIAYHYYQKADYPNALQAYDSFEQISRTIKDTNAIAWALTGKGTVFHSQSDYPRALQYYLQSAQLFEKIGKTTEAASIMGNAGVLYKEMGDLASALNYFQQGLKIHENAGNKSEIARFLNNIGGVYMDQHKLALAEEAFMKCLSISEEEDDKHLVALVLRNLLELKGLEGNYGQALDFGYRSLLLYQSLGETEGIVDDYFQLADIHLKQGKPDSALYYAKKSLSLAQGIGFKRNIHNTYEVLAKAYAATNNFQKAYESQQLHDAYKDSLTGEDKKNVIAGLTFQYELDKKQSQIELLKKDQQLKLEKARHQRQRMYVLIAGLGVVVLAVAIIAFIQFRHNKQRKKANLLLQQQKEKVESTLSELKATQAQLIQSEKMASLGELTAGIAHEIQNPLNFVNNFSELNTELIDELKQEINTGNIDEIRSLANDIKENEQKINHHGKRADAIVKGMLQHSRTSTGDKEPTDINDLADEYLRLSYHGLRAKDKAFQAILHTDFDLCIDKINVIPQDIGRVLLNLYNNAFYAAPLPHKGRVDDPNYKHEPTVWVSTKKEGNKVLISVRDNGPGIPQKVLDKIFQPFFTTKPTGQGTGLGLSLSYDIIKAHGGEIKVATKEGEGAEFIIQLPVA